MLCYLFELFVNMDVEGRKEGREGDNELFIKI